MAQRDYISRRKTTGFKKKKKTKKKTYPITLALLIIAGFAAGLYFLKHSNEEIYPKQSDKSVIQDPNDSALPNRPEEIWSYIKELETREVPVGENPLDNAQLNDEQKKILALIAQDQASTGGQGIAAEYPPANPSAVSNNDGQAKSNRVAEIAVNATNAAEKKQVQAEKTSPPTNKTPSTTKTPATSGQAFGLQCGAFKNDEQASNLKAKLALTGLESRINSAGEWRRVIIGPVANRQAAEKLRVTASSVASCNIIGM